MENREIIKHGNTGIWRYKTAQDKLMEMLDEKKEHKFKTIQEAEEYFMGKYAYTNNAHNEEDSRMDRWLAEQDIEECEN